MNRDALEAAAAYASAAADEPTDDAYEAAHAVAREWRAICAEHPLQALLLVPDELGRALHVLVRALPHR